MKAACVVLCVFAYVRTLDSVSIVPVNQNACSQGSYCNSCIDDIHHMGGTLASSVTLIDNRLTSLKNGLTVGLNKINNSATNVNSNIRLQKPKVLSQINIFNSAIISQLNSLKVAINKKLTSEHAGFEDLLKKIYQSQTKLQVTFGELNRYVQKILIMVQNPAIVNKIGTVNLAIGDISKAITVLQNSVLRFGNLDQLAQLLNPLGVSIQSLSLSLVDVKQSFTNLFGIQNTIKNSVQSISVTQETVYKRIIELINTVNTRNADIIKTLTLYYAIMIPFKSIVKQVYDSVKSVTFLLANYKNSVSRLETTVMNVDKEISVVYNSVTSFSQMSTRIAAVVARIKSKNSQTSNTFTSLQSNVKKLLESFNFYVTNQNQQISQLLLNLDSVFALQKKTLATVNALISALKSRVQIIGRTIGINSATFARVSVKVSSVGITMSKAIDILKNLVNNCKCGVSNIPSRCPMICSSIVSVVCASNGVTYSNNCEMDKAACNMQTVLTVASNAPCEYATAQPTWIPPTTAQPPTTPATPPKTQPPSPCTRICPQTVSAVCGSDGKTYSSRCDLEKRNCLTGSNIAFVHSGSCVKTTTPKNCYTACPQVNQPVCGSDGNTYSNICLLNRHNCIQGTTIFVRSFSPCTTAPPLTTRQKCDLQCTRIYKPVCGTDKMTYSNICILRTRACVLNVPSLFKHTGPCIACPVIDCTPGSPAVCGSDGKNYINQCTLKMAACRTKKTIKVANTGNCLPAQCMCPFILSPVCGSDGKTYSNDCLRKCTSASSSTPGFCSVCTGEFSKVAGISGCFFFEPPTITTDPRDAHADCRRRGAALIIFATDAEYKTMRKHVIRMRINLIRRKRNYWTAGAEISKTSTKWAWTPQNYPMTLKTAWFHKRPIRENACAAMYGTIKYALVDVNCNKAKLNDKYGWICRK